MRFTPEEIGRCQALMYMEKITGDQDMGHYKTMTGAYAELACGFSGTTSTQNYR